MAYIYRRLVSEKVTDYTMYNNGKYRHYISLFALKSLFAQICEINECPEYIRITPFYKHSKKDIWIEFDEYMCYIESTEENLTSTQVKTFRESCEEKNTLEKVESQYNLVNTFDITEFHSSLWRYMDYLYSLIPKLAQEIKKTRNLSETDLSLGEFCFEIHCE